MLHGAWDYAAFKGVFPMTILTFVFALTTGLIWADILEQMEATSLHFMVHMSVLMFSFILGLAALSETYSSAHRFLVSDLERHPVMPRASRAALLVVTHDPGVGRRADRVLRMHDGKIVARVAGADLPGTLGFGPDQPGAGA